MHTQLSTNTTHLHDSALHVLLEKISQQIGAQKVTRPSPDRLTPFDTDRNVSQFRSRAAPARIGPATVAEVQTVARLFSEQAAPATLYPISTGRNWGLGSFLPAHSGSVALDLRALSAIRHIDLQGGWAEVEPGVTQLVLSKELAGTDRVLNVTASSGHTSILGNALDRGVGLRHQRTNDLLGLEVVLPDGNIIKVGWWPHPNGPRAINPFGLGPSLLHLFTQSNLGIVTAGIVKLLPRPECRLVIRTTFSSQSMRTAIDVLRGWVAQEIVSGVVKVYDAASTRNYGGEPDRHLVLMSISGTPAKCDVIGKLLAAEAASAGCFSAVDIFDSTSIPASDTVLNVVAHAFGGDPVFNETMLRAATGQDAENVDALGNGWVFFLPLIPFSGEAAEQAMLLLNDIQEETGIAAGTTINTLSPDVIDLVVSFKFDPEPSVRAQAMKALDLAYEKFHRAGFHPYRLDIEHASWPAAHRPDDGADRITRHLKSLIDPTGVIAPGRYA